MSGSVGILVGVLAGVLVDIIVDIILGVGLLVAVDLERGSDVAAGVEDARTVWITVGDGVSGVGEASRDGVVVTAGGDAQVLKAGTGATCGTVWQATSQAISARSRTTRRISAPAADTSGRAS